MIDTMNRAEALDPETAATLEDLRALHLAAGDSGRVRLFGLLARMAAGRFTAAARPPDSVAQWQFEGHPTCPRCACPPRSAGGCLGPGCTVTIESVQEIPPRWCSIRCRRRWYASLPRRRENEH